MNRKILMTVATALLLTVLTACAGSAQADEYTIIQSSQSETAETLMETEQPTMIEQASLEELQPTEMPQAKETQLAAEPTAAPQVTKDTELVAVPVAAAKTEQTSAQDGTTTAAWINGSNVNLRSAPSLDSQVIAVLGYRQELLLLSSADGWGLVRTDGKEGYVYMEFVTASDSTAELAAKHEPAAEVPANGFTIAIDAGHQAKGNNENEPIGPGAEESKPKVSSGTHGTTTNVPEYKLTLAVSLKLRDELLARGYNVFMIRETNEVDISNRERADMATDVGADVLVRIHADGSTNSGVNGILMLCPTKNNRFVPNLYAESRRLSDNILSSMVEATGAKNRGVSEVDNMSGINWSTMPVTIVEMGLMTNPTEDTLMQTEEYQQKLVTGIADGVDQYFTVE